MKRARANKPTKVMGRTPVQVGDYVLLGMPGISEPSHWQVGEVLWVGLVDILVERVNDNGTEHYRQVRDVTDIRAIGTLQQVIDIGIRAEAEVRPLLQAHAAAEAAERDAQRAIFHKLDEFAKAEPLRDASAGF